MRDVNIALRLAVIIALTATGLAHAQTDPPAESPAGTIYEIPLDTAREDAAPVGAGPGGHPRPATPDSTAPPAEESAIRSENGFGSSSHVPGTEPGADASHGRTKRRPRRRSGDEGKRPEESAPAGDRKRAAQAAGAQPEDGGGPSLALGLLLAVVAAAVGISAGSAVTRSRQAP